MEANIHTPLTEHLGIEYPIICGPMYPCSNPELVATVSEAGGMGVVQPVSMEYVHKLKLEDGFKKMREITQKPLGMNALIEASSKSYEQRVRHWVEVALEHGVRFFITSLGNPRWVVDIVKPHQGLVYHDVTNAKHAEKAVKAGVHGLIAVNSRAGGHAGNKTPADLYKELCAFNLPIVCAGGVSEAAQVRESLKIGYVGVQLGTRFIATKECTAHEDYKRKIIEAQENDIVLTERVTGVPLAVIKTPYIEKVGTKANFVARWMLRGRTTKKIMRMIYFIGSGIAIKKSSLRPPSSKDYLQAGKSVQGIHAVQSVADVMSELISGLKSTQ